jgi:hypothetical protein
VIPLIESIEVLCHRFDDALTSISPPLPGILGLVGQSFPPFSGIQCKGRRNQEHMMKKPKIEADEQQPRKIIRADKAPTEGYSLVVDGHFKSHHDTVEAAEEAGLALKNQYQMLQVQVYDAATKTRSMIEWPAPV